MYSAHFNLQNQAGKMIDGSNNSITSSEKNNQTQKKTKTSKKKKRNRKIWKNFFSSPLLSFLRD